MFMMDCTQDFCLQINEIIYVLCTCKEIQLLSLKNRGLTDEVFVLNKIFKCICPFVGGKKMSKHSSFLFFYFLPPLEINFYMQSNVKVTVMSA